MKKEEKQKLTEEQRLELYYKKSMERIDNLRKQFIRTPGKNDIIASKLN